MRCIVITCLGVVLGLGQWGCAGSTQYAADGPVVGAPRPPALPLPCHHRSQTEPTAELMARLTSPPLSLPSPDDLKVVDVSLASYGLPYEPVDVMSGFDARRGRRGHRAIDFGGVGPDSGLGTPIFAIGRSRITLLGRPDEAPGQFGRPLRGNGTVRRGGRRLPSSMHLPEYGRVYFFTRSYGSWRSGTVIVTELLDGPLTGYTVRYMHLGAIHPDLEVGDVIEPGQEIGLMGGTAVQEVRPHLHIDAENPDGERIDLAPYLGLDGEEGDQDGPHC